MSKGLDEVRVVKEKAVAMLGVLGITAAAVGITKEGDTYGLKVNLAEPYAGKLPTGIDGVPILKYEVVGEVAKR